LGILGISGVLGILGMYMGCVVLYWVCIWGVVCCIGYVYGVWCAILGMYTGCAVRHTCLLRCLFQRAPTIAILSAANALVGLFVG